MLTNTYCYSLCSLQAFKHLSFTSTEVFEIQKVVAAVLHLGNVQFKVGNQGGEGESR